MLLDATDRSNRWAFSAPEWGDVIGSVVCHMGMTVRGAQHNQPRALVFKLKVSRHSEGYRAEQEVISNPTEPERSSGILFDFETDRRWLALNTARRLRDVTDRLLRTPAPTF